VTDTIEPMAAQIDQQKLAEELVAQAREEGVQLVGPGGLLTGLTKSVVETALEEELSDHLGYDKHDPSGRNGGNSRNGYRAKTVLTEIGPVEIEVPRDRDGSFEPAIVRKRQRRLNGIDDIVLSLTARGLTTGEVAAHFAEVYGAKVSKDTISRITDKVIEEMTEWRNRPLDRGRFLVIVANQLAMRWLRHRAMSCRGVRSSRHSRGRSLSSSATSRIRRSLISPRSVLLGKYWRSRPFVFSFVPRCHGEWASAK
jgi:hypothetical protein